jgi:hypothetical protein
VKDHLAVLADFRASLAAIRLDDDGAFQRAIVRGQALLGVSQAEFASWFSLSRATVNRWSTGATAPYPGLRKVVLERLARRVGYHQRRLRGQTGTNAGDDAADDHSGGTGGDTGASSAPVPPRNAGDEAPPTPTTTSPTAATATESADDSSGRQPAPLEATPTSMAA